MIKLYILYFLFGFYMFFWSVAMWLTSAFSGANDLKTYTAIVSSFVMFEAASALSLYKVKLACIVGLISLIGVFPFGIHWLIYRYIYEAPITKGEFNWEVLIATALYIVTAFYSVKYIFNPKLPIRPLKRHFRVFLTFLPIVIFLVFLIYLINP